MPSINHHPLFTRMNKQIFFFCGIGGSGMSAIAQVLLHQGHTVRGSDRSYDQGQNADLYAQLQTLGVALFPQDGSGVDADVDVLVVSSAVEPDDFRCTGGAGSRYCDSQAGRGCWRTCFIAGRGLPWGGRVENPRWRG